MGTSLPSGSLPPPSLPHSNDNLTDEADELSTMEQHLDRQQYVKDVRHHQTALNTERDAAIIAALQGYSTGTPIIVTWFNSMESVATKQSTFTDLSFDTDSVNCAYHRINNFELLLQEPFNFTYDGDTVTSEVIGEGLVLPGFKALTGDLFIYEIEAGVLGLFKVTSAPTRMSIKTGTSHTVPFKLVKILKESELIEIIDRVRETSYFNKQRFLSDDAALLKRGDVLDLQYIEEKRRELVHFYIDEFHEHEYQSFARPDGVYDPYIVSFISSVMDLRAFGSYAEQLITKPNHAKTSFWEKLRSPKMIDWSRYTSIANQALWEVSATSNKVTSLVNRPYIELLDDDTGYPESETYISENIGNFDTGTYTPFDTLIAYHMEYQVVDVDILVSLIDDVYNEEPIDQFYRIPVYVFLLWILERAIQSGRDVKLSSPEMLPYIEIEFTQPGEHMVVDVLTIMSPESKVHGLIDNNGDPVYPEALDIAYTPTGFTIDLAPIKAELGIMTDLTGTWKVVISNTSILQV